MTANSCATADALPLTPPEASPTGTADSDVARARQQFVENLSFIRAQAHGTAHRLALPSLEREDFVGWCLLKLVESDFARIRQYHGSSSFKTFVTVVVTNLGRDYRKRLWGRFRPSTQAAALGYWAVELERLRAEGWRDGEAIGLLANEPFAPPSEVLESLLSDLPERPVRFFVSETVLDDYESPTRTSLEGWLWAESLEVDRRVVERLEEALRSLKSDDRAILRRRYRDRQSVKQIAFDLGLPTSKLYGRIYRLLDKVRQELDGAFDSPEAARAFCQRFHASSLDLDWP